MQFILLYDPQFAEVVYRPLQVECTASSFPDYLHDEILFECNEAPNFLRRLLQTIYETGLKKKT